MCWVMPPASPATTSVSRIASSSDVLPWSTWPMIVTTGGRSISSSSAVVEDGRLGDLLGGADHLDLAVERVGEHLDGLVGKGLRERRHLAERHQLLDHVGTADAEDLGNLAHGGARGHLQRRLLDLDMRPERRLFEQRATTASTAAARRAAWRRVRHLIAARGLRVDDDAATLLLAGAATVACRRRPGVAWLRVGLRRAGLLLGRRGLRPGRGPARSPGGGRGSSVAGAQARGSGGGSGSAPPLAASSAFSATSSSTLEAAAFASTPAAWRAARTSLLVRPRALAIS